MRRKPEEIGQSVGLLLLVDNLEQGGTQSQFLLLAGELAQRERVDLRVGCLSTRGPLFDELAGLDCPVEEFPLRGFYHWTVLRQTLRLVRYCRSNDIDIVHSFDFYANVLAAAACACVSGVQLLASRRYWILSRRKVHEWGERFSYRVAGAVLFNSYEVADWAVNKGYLPEEKVRVVPNGVPERAFAWGGDAKREGELTVGVVGRLCPDKDHETLLRALALVDESSVRHRLLVVGDGELANELQGLARRLGLTGRITWVGEQADVGPWLERMDIGVLPSRREGLPNVLLEYLAAGLAVVATDVGAVGEVVRNEVEGLLVPAEDPEPMAEALRRLLDDRRLRETLGRRGRERAEDYTVPAMTERTLSVYSDLLDTVRKHPDAAAVRKA